MQWNALSSLGKHFELYKPRWAARSLWNAGPWAVGRCWLCTAATPDGARLCDGCRSDLPLRHDVLLRRNVPGIDAAYAPLHYTFPVTTLVRAAKFSADLCALRILCDVLAASTVDLVRRSAADALVPIPLSPFRFARRGYNQAGELARALHGVADVGIRQDWLRRRGIWGRAQSTLDARQRQDNVAQAFAATRHDLSGLHILLVDDVLTTGATCSAAARTLRAAGAATVSVVAVAATPLAIP